MRTNHIKPGILGLALIIGGTIALTGKSAYADDDDATGTEIEEVVVTGTRGKPRAVTDSAVPVDVFSSEEIQKVSQHNDFALVLRQLRQCRGDAGATLLVDSPLFRRGCGIRQLLDRLIAATAPNHVETAIPHDAKEPGL